MNPLLPASARVGEVQLAVSSLKASVEFYSNVVGLSVLGRDAAARRAELGVAGSALPLLKLVEFPGLAPLGRHRRLGLYHFAVLLPHRGDLAAFVRHITEVGVEFGSADHLVSEATYLVDPDGLTVEVYADRPRDQWRFFDHEVQMAVDPIDWQDLMTERDGPWRGAPSGTTIGHMHFYIGDLKQAARFYCEVLGFDLMASLPGAIFVAAGGYHHHVGLNTWAARSPVASESDPRLLSWELVLPSEEAVSAVRDRLEEIGLQEKGAGFADPWGIRVHLVARSG